MRPAKQRPKKDGVLPRRKEQQLIRAAQNGCQGSARQLIDAHKERLFAFVWRILRDHHDAEEICQEAFLRAFSALSSFSQEYRFSTWLFTIAYRLCLNHLRRKPPLSGEVEFSTFDGGEAEASLQVANSEEAQHLKEAVWSAVDRLSVHQRATVLLFYREGMSCEDIGGVLEMPVATVKSHLHRARNRLREMLTPQLAADWTALRFFGEGAG
ncbi:MAG: RNA polymerase sigma factor [Phycisphaerae bacterium]|nr:RNA polymerase sigma factor [Phycisphaerae bacterium]